MYMRKAQNIHIQEENHMFTSRFGIEIEFTGITRNDAAKVAADFLNGTVTHTGDYYDTKKVTAPDGRVWKFMSDGSISCQKKQGRQKVAATRDYSVELVSPILTYREDIEILQELVRQLRRAGGFANNSCGIHIHLNGSDHTPRSIRNFMNIIASKNDLFYKALQIAPERMSYCKKMDSLQVSFALTSLSLTGASRRKQVLNGTSTACGRIDSVQELRPALKSESSLADALRIASAGFSFFRAFRN